MTFFFIAHTNLVLILLRIIIAKTSNFYPQIWLSVVTFSLGFLVDAVIALVGLCSMEIVPHHMAGGAHGVACAVSQGRDSDIFNHPPVLSASVQLSRPCRFVVKCLYQGFLNFRFSRIYKSGISSIGPEQKVICQVLGKGPSWLR